jgi:hypothetical protein
MVPVSPPVEPPLDSPMEPTTTPTDLPTESPEIAPSQAPTPAENATEPAPAGAILPATCSLPEPGNDFKCINGDWVSDESVSLPDLTLPTGKVIVQGRLTVESSLTLHKATELIIDDCVKIGPGGVIVTFTKEDMDQLAKNGGESTYRIIHSNNGNNCPESSDLSSIAVTSNWPNGCRRVKTTTSGDRASLFAKFKLDRSRCNLAIIVPSVLGGVLLIAIIIIIVVRAVKKPRGQDNFKHPFSKYQE